jgi:5-methylcytosine-specific restriction endonuclease McrA
LIAIGENGIIEMVENRFQQFSTDAFNLNLAGQGDVYFNISSPCLPPLCGGVFMPVIDRLSKNCPSCKELLLVSNFNKNRASNDGRDNYCRSCLKLRRRSKNERDQVLSKIKDQDGLLESGFKICRTCEQVLSLDNFYKAIGRRDGYGCYCKVCESKRHSAKYALNPEKYREINRKKGQGRKEYFSNYQRVNKEAHVLRQTRRHVKKVGNGGSHTLGEWVWIKFVQNNTCLMCGRSEPEIKLTKDHIVPISKGGTDNIGNIQGLCHSCNCSKNAKFIDLRGIKKVKKLK